MNFGDMMISAAIANGNPGALACWTELSTRDDKQVLQAIIALAGFTGEPLYLLWSDCFSKEATKVAEALKGLSYNRLCEIRQMLETPPLGIQEARIALGVSEVRCDDL